MLFQARSSPGTIRLAGGGIHCPPAFSLKATLRLHRNVCTRARSFEASFLFWYIPSKATCVSPECRDLLERRPPRRDLVQLALVNEPLPLKSNSEGLRLAHEARGIVRPAALLMKQTVSTYRVPDGQPKQVNEEVLAALSARSPQPLAQWPRCSQLAVSPGIESSS